MATNKLVAELKTERTRLKGQVTAIDAMLRTYGIATGSGGRNTPATSGASGSGAENAPRVGFETLSFALFIKNNHQQ